MWPIGPIASDIIAIRVFSGRRGGCDGRERQRTDSNGHVQGQFYTLKSGMAIHQISR